MTDRASPVYQICTRCVMDTSDPEITFDDEGVCSHCHEFDDVTSKRWFPGPEGGPLLDGLVERIRASGRTRQYDCILGLSGGVDSSFLALKAKDWDLRVLALHVDAGWNTEIAVSNIERVVNYCGFDLQTKILDWREVRDLQLAFLKSGVSNQDVPQDHAFFAGLYSTASENRVKYVLNGGNIATESVFPTSWHGSAMDRRSLIAIHQRFGRVKLRSYPTIGFVEYYVVNPFLRRTRVVRPLNYMSYDRDVAVEELRRTVGFKDYGRKHGESQFTRFFQNYYLPERFGFDKRRPHLSSMVLSGQITRDDALAELHQPLYDEDELRSDRNYLLKKLRLSDAEFDELLTAPRHTVDDYPNHKRAYRAMKLVQARVQSATGRDMRAYG